jgi:hypothetical protein
MSWEYKFTPTPWHINFDVCEEFATIESENNKTIAEVNRNDDAEEMKANAHLLNAAPKMYLFIELVSKVSHDPELRNHAQFLLREANGEKPKIRARNQK